MRHVVSQAIVQQEGLVAHTAAAHGEHVADNGPPVLVVGWAHGPPSKAALVSGRASAMAASGTDEPSVMDESVCASRSDPDVLDVDGVGLDGLGLDAVAGPGGRDRPPSTSLPGVGELGGSSSVSCKGPPFAHPIPTIRQESNGTSR